MFAALCEELCQLQLRILRRDGAPALLAQHVARLVRQHSTACRGGRDSEGNSGVLHRSARDEQVIEQSMLYAQAAHGDAQQQQQEQHEQQQHKQEQQEQPQGRCRAVAAAERLGGACAATACVPLFLRCCATACKHLSDAESTDALCMLDTAHRLAREYVLAGHGNVNEAATVLRSVHTLCEWQQQRHAEQEQLRRGVTQAQSPRGTDTVQQTSLPPRALPRRTHGSAQMTTTQSSSEGEHVRRHALAQLLPCAYQVAMDKWYATQPMQRRAFYMTQAQPWAMTTTDAAATTTATVVTPNYYNSVVGVSEAAGVQPHCLTTLSLLRACSTLHAREFVFTATSHDMHGLLPCKSAMEMEAKMQCCAGARALLCSLRRGGSGSEYALNHIDAGMCIATMASTGLYDVEVCDSCCGVLQQSHALLTSQQLCEVLYSLGVLQHRWRSSSSGSSSSGSSSSGSSEVAMSPSPQRWLASCVEAKHCSAAAMRQFVLALAMLRQRPPSERALMDGVFLHALRASHAHQRRNNGGKSSNDNSHRRTTAPAAAAAAAARRRADGALHELPAAWYIDVAHALACLGVEHDKYRLLTTRHARRALPQLSTEQCCKLLYGIGGVPSTRVHDTLREAWQQLVTPTVAATAQRLRTLDRVADGPRVMSALLHCGMHEHPRIPRPPLPSSSSSQVRRTSNDDDDGRSAAATTPSDALLQTWQPTSHEHVLDATQSSTRTVAAPTAHGSAGTTTTTTRTTTDVTVP